MTVLPAHRMPNFPFLQVVAGYLFPHAFEAGGCPALGVGGRGF